MNVRCPECKTLFRLADDKVGAGGAKVRCGKCRHVFIATRADGSVASATSVGPAPAGTIPPGASPTLTLPAATQAFGTVPPTPAAAPPALDFPAAEPSWGPPIGASPLSVTPTPGQASAPPVSSAPPAAAEWDPAIDFSAFEDEPSAPSAVEAPIDAATAMGRRRSAEDEDAPIDAATAMGRRKLSEEPLRPRWISPPKEPEAEPPPRTEPARMIVPPEEDEVSAPSAAPQEPPTDYAPPDLAMAYDDHTVIEDRPHWLGNHEDSLMHARGAAVARGWTDDRQSSPAIPAPRREATPPPQMSPLVDEPAAPSSLDPEALFGGEDESLPPSPTLPPIIASTPTAMSPAAARLAERREAAQKRVDSDGALRPRRTVERPFISPVHGRRAILRAGLLVVALAGVLAIFVIWRNDWHFEPVGMMMARAFGGAGAPRVRSQIPTLVVRKVRRDVYESASGQPILAISGEVENDGAERLASVSVLVRLQDREGNPMAEREQFAVGTFEPEVLSGFTDAAGVDAEYKRRRARSVVSPGGRLEFTILFFPMPREVEGLRQRVLVEVTGAVPSRS